MRLLSKSSRHMLGMPFLLLLILSLIFTTTAATTHTNALCPPFAVLSDIGCTISALTMPAVTQGDPALNLAPTPKTAVLQCSEPTMLTKVDKYTQLVGEQSLAVDQQLSIHMIANSHDDIVDANIATLSVYLAPRCHGVLVTCVPTDSLSLDVCPTHPTFESAFTPSNTVTIVLCYPFPSLGVNSRACPMCVNNTTANNTANIQPPTALGSPSTGRRKSGKMIKPLVGTTKLVYTQGINSTEGYWSPEGMYPYDNMMMQFGDNDQHKSYGTMFINNTVINGLHPYIFIGNNTMMEGWMVTSNDTTALDIRVKNNTVRGTNLCCCCHSCCCKCCHCCCHCCCCKPCCCCCKPCCCKPYCCKPCCCKSCCQQCCQQCCGNQGGCCDGSGGDSGGGDSSGGDGGGGDGGSGDGGGGDCSGRDGGGDCNGGGNGNDNGNSGEFGGSNNNGNHDCNNNCNGNHDGNGEYHNCGGGENHGDESGGHCGHERCDAGACNPGHGCNTCPQAPLPPPPPSLPTAPPHPDIMPLPLPPHISMPPLPSMAHLPIRLSPPAAPTASAVSKLYPCLKIPSIKQTVIINQVVPALPVQAKAHVAITVTPTSTLTKTSTATNVAAAATACLGVTHISAYTAETVSTVSMVYVTKVHHLVSTLTVVHCTDYPSSAPRKLLPTCSTLSNVCNPIPLAASIITADNVLHLLPVLNARTLPQKKAHSVKVPPIIYPKPLPTDLGVVSPFAAVINVRAAVPVAVPAVLPAAVLAVLPATILPAQLAAAPAIIPAVKPAAVLPTNAATLPVTLPATQIPLLIK